MLPAVKRGKISSKIFQLRRRIFHQNHSFSRRIKADFPQSQAISSLFKSFKPWRSGFLILHEYSQSNCFSAPCRVCQKRKARPLSFFALLRKAHLCPFCILSFLCRSRSRYRKVDSYSYFAIWYSSSTASCSEPVCFSI